jgi:hypothetical protein
MLGVTAAALAAPRAAFAQASPAITMAGLPEDSATPVLYAIESGAYKRSAAVRPRPAASPAAPIRSARSVCIR